MQAFYPRTDTSPTTKVKERSEIWPQCGAHTHYRIAKSGGVRIRFSVRSGLRSSAPKPHWIKELLVPFDWEDPTCEPPNQDASAGHCCTREKRYFSAICVDI